MLHYKERANKTLSWRGTDTIKNYKNVTNGVPNPYSMTEIQYTYNSSGFRCDEFDLPSDIPIVFLGCSFTEGIGLHQHETWAYQFLTRIRTVTGVNIPYWNLGLGASGVDTAARHLYLFSKTNKFVYVFGLLPGMHRRELGYDTDKYNLVIPGDPYNKYLAKINELLVDTSFIQQQSEKSLMLIDAVRQIQQPYVSLWTRDPEGEVAAFPDLNLNYYAKIDIDLARDGQHPGPKWHERLTDTMWEKHKHLFGAHIRHRT